MRYSINPERVVRVERTTYPRSFIRDLNRDPGLASRMVRPNPGVLPSFSPYVLDAELNDIWKICETLKDNLEQMKDKYPDYVALELDILSKTCVQNGSPPSWYLSYVMHPGHDKWYPDETMIEWFKGMKFDVSEKTVASRLKFPRGTNHGWPTFRSDDEDLELNVLLGSFLREPEDLDYLSSKGSLPMIGTMLSRSGHTNKSSPLWIDGTDPYYEAEVYGVYPRKRLVAGMPASLNAAQRPQMKSVFDSQWQFAGFNVQSVEDIALLLLQFNYRYADDTSGLDSSITARCMKEFLEPIFDGAVHEHGPRGFHSWQATLPLLGPGPFGPRLWLREGYEASGYIFTSRDDTAVTFDRVVRSVSYASGRDIRKLLAQFGKEWVCIVFGDDVVIGSNFQIDVDLYREFGAAIGLKVKIAPPSFLMHYLPKKGEEPFKGPTPFVSRFIQNVFFPERPKTDPLNRLVGLIAKVDRIRMSPFYTQLVAPWLHPLLLKLDSELLNDWDSIRENVSRHLAWKLSRNELDSTELVDLTYKNFFGNFLSETTTPEELEAASFGDYGYMAGLYTRKLTTKQRRAGIDMTYDKLLELAG